MSDGKIIEIEFCIKCNWLLRSSWMAQELISTFATSIKGITLIPGEGGIFEIRCGDSMIWSLKEKGKFPDIKELKRAVRDCINPDMDLGHLDR